MNDIGQGSPGMPIEGSDSWYSPASITPTTQLGFSVKLYVVIY